MARFDVYPLPAEQGYLLDCQADSLWRLDTRFVVPLLPPAMAPPIAARLNPLFRVNDGQVVMVTQSASAVRNRMLRDPVASLSDHQSEIMNAIDMLLTGY